MNDGSWVDLRLDAETDVESIRAHFEGHAYDPHWHDCYLVGFTEQGVQQFNCRKTLHSSVAGQAFLLEPGELHDGRAPVAGGFTYSTLYLPPKWLDAQLRELFSEAPDDCLPGFAETLANEPDLFDNISYAFQAIHAKELRIVRHAAVDALLDKLSRRMHWRKRLDSSARMPTVAIQTRDYLHAHLDRDVGLDELAAINGVDRFRLSRAFKASFGLPPHAYLVQLRLSLARKLLRQGLAPAAVAVELGFSDQSHLGRWFRRAYGLSPAAYRKQCSNLPDA